MNFNIQHSTFSIQHFLRLIRPVNLLMILFTQYMVRFALLYPIFRSKDVRLQVNEMVFALFAFSFVLLAAGGYIINDYYDVEIDKINKPDKVIVGNQIKSASALNLYWILSITGAVSGCIASYVMKIPSLSALFLFYFFGLWLYSRYLKRVFIAGNIIIALFVALVPLAAGMSEIINIERVYTDNAENLPLCFDCLIVIAVFAFLINLEREIVKDIEDMEGDTVQGCRTMPIVIGRKATVWVVLLLLTLTLCLIGYIQYFEEIEEFNHVNLLTSIIYLICFLQLPILYIVMKLILASTSSDFHKIGNWLKIIMLTGISYLFVFAHLS